MDYTSIHIYGHLLSDDILHNIERDNTLNGNRDQDFGMDICKRLRVYTLHNSKKAVTAD